MKYILVALLLFVTISLKAQKKKYRAYETCSVVLNDQNAKCNFEKCNILILIYEYKMVVYTKDIIELKLVTDATVNSDDPSKKVVSWTAEDQNKNYLQLKFITYHDADGGSSSNMVLSYTNKKMTFKLGPANEDD